MSRILTRGGSCRKDITKDYNVIMYEDSDDVARDKMEMWIAKNIGSAVMKAYPNREWGVRVNIEGQMVILSCDDLSQTLGYHLHFKNDTITKLQKRTVRAAGEVLERYGISRNKMFDPDIIETLNRDFTDEVINEDARPE